MKRLSIYTQGVKGGSTNISERGYIAVLADGEKLLSIDNFRGQGENYKKPENPIICIFGETDGNVIFEGTHSQLIEKLK